MNFANRQPWTTAACRIAACSACLLLQVCSQATTPLDSRGVDFEASSEWRVLNLVKVTYGWTIAELQFFGDSACSEQLSATSTAEAIASGYDTGAPPSRALDGKTYTEWRAQCHLCDSQEAWLGVRFDQPVKVLCVKMWQWGDRDYSASSIVVQRWSAGSQTEASGWKDVLRGEGLGGSRWNAIRFVKCKDLAIPNEGNVQVSNSGYYPSEARFTCNGIRLMAGQDTSVCSIDGDWSVQPPRCWAALEIIAIATGVTLGAFFWGSAYYRFVVAKKPPALQHDTFIPSDSLGDWTATLKDDCTSDNKTFLQCLFCPFCRIADTWSQAGLLPYRFGVCLQQACCVCLPCIGAYFRHKLRQRFVIRRESTVTDFASWIFLICCAAVQEAKQVDSLCVVAFEEEIARIAAEKRKEEDDSRRAEAAAEEKRRQSTSFHTLNHNKRKEDVHLSRQTGQVRKSVSTLEMMQTLQGPNQQTMGNNQV